MNLFFWRRTEVDVEVEDARRERLYHLIRMVQRQRARRGCNQTEAWAHYVISQVPVGCSTEQAINVVERHFEDSETPCPWLEFATL